MRNYWTYVAKRLLQAIPLLFGIIILNFVIIHSAPGDPTAIIAGEYAPPEYVEELRVELGLDKPLYEQLYLYMLKILRGNLGHSFYFGYGTPVLDTILSRLPATILLMITQLIFSTLFGILLGTISSTRRDSFIDYLTTSISLFGYSIPAFWLGQIFIIIFALGLGWLPVGGMISFAAEGDLEKIVGVAKHLILPALTLGLYNLALTTRLTRVSMIQVLLQDFITTARAKGLSERVVIYKHALRNAMLPVITIVGMQFGYIFSGAVLIETVFAWPGLGRLTFEAIIARDYPLLLGLLIFVSIIVIIAALITDLLYGWLDPRVRYGRK